MGLGEAPPVFQEVHRVRLRLGDVAAILGDPDFLRQGREAQGLQPVRPQAVVDAPVRDHDDAVEVEDQTGVAQGLEVALSRAGHTEDRLGAGAEAVVVTAQIQLEVEQPRRRRQVEKPVGIHNPFGKHSLHSHDT